MACRAIYRASLTVACLASCMQTDIRSPCKPDIAVLGGNDSPLWQKLTVFNKAYHLYFSCDNVDMALLLEIRDHILCKNTCKVVGHEQTTVTTLRVYRFNVYKR
jgi:hypothetical protein